MDSENNQAQAEPFVLTQTPLEKQLCDVVNPIVVSQKCELVRLRVTGQGGHATLALYVDTLPGQTPITMDQLEFLNRLIGDALDVADADGKLFRASYQLEVSSPGLDRHLSKVSHFEAALGKQIQLKTDGQLGRPKALSGILLGVNPELGIEVQAAKDEQKIEFPWAALRDAHLVFEFEKGFKKRR